jgi:hypothetical protein
VKFDNSFPWYLDKDQYIAEAKNLSIVSPGILIRTIIAEVKNMTIVSPGILIRTIIAEAENLAIVSPCYAYISSLPLQISNYFTVY